MSNGCKANMKKILNRKSALMVFVWILTLMVIQNPMFQPLNIVFSSSQITTTQYSSGLVFQGSCLVNTVINNVQAVNSTSGLPVNAYQVTVTVFNFMSLMLLFLPIIIYIYYEYNKVLTPINKRKRNIK
jgi:hypothetical protein